LCPALLTLLLNTTKKNQNQIGLSAFWKTIREIHFAAAVNRGGA